MNHQPRTLYRNAGKKNVEIKMKVHPNSSGVIIVNYPGITGDIDGYANKYGKIADMLQKRNIGAVVRLGNPDTPDMPYPDFMLDNLKAVIDFSLQNSQRICGSGNPALYLMGFSAGASSAAAVSSDYAELQKMLLIAPSGDAGQDRVERGLGNYKGEVFITIGNRDEIVGPGAGKTFYDTAKRAKRKELVVIPNCDHQFRGRINGMIMSKAPLWAFAGDTSYPSPKGGVELYQ